ncbi:MAG TPA: right-handed parallel beta-helix repeat-containing protein, partial [Ktedonobacterales bacterium]
AYHGIEIRERGNPTARRNYITENGWYAIKVYDSSGGLFEDNDLRGNGQGEWYIDASSEGLVRRAHNLE